MALGRRGPWGGDGLPAFVFFDFTMGALMALVVTGLLNLRRPRGYYRRNSPPPQPLPEPRPC
ncbi:hypothetical protein [Streptacidiphilus monticola]|uniref:Uncharacterized protein n=1 Tax=Streptacidiphilus monticola TaxID=2161674 RepID=A0ABW1FW99_9ACTN